MSTMDEEAKLFGWMYAMYLPRVKESPYNLLIRKADLSGFMDVLSTVTDREGDKVLDESTLSCIQKMLDGEEVEGHIPH